MATQRPGPRAPAGATLALTVTLAVAVFALVMPLIMGAIPAQPLPAPFPAQHQRGETLTYLLAFGVIGPLALLVARRLDEAITAGPHADALGGIVAVLAAALAAAVTAVKLLDRLGFPDGVAIVVAPALWWLAAGALLVFAVKPGAKPSLELLARREPAAWAATGLLTLAALMCFTDLGSISLPAVALGAGAAAAATAAHGRIVVARLPRRWGLALDLAALGVLLALVPDLVIFRPEAAAGELAAALDTGIIQFHHNFLLGPANEVIHGRAMLTGTASQYGVASIYLLVGWFQFAPIGYGTLGLLTGGLTALWFGAGYLVLRLGGTSRPLAVSAFALAIVALVFNLAYPVGALPQSGPLRFGLPMAVVLAGVAGERFPRHQRVAGMVMAGFVGLSSIWALEAFVYTVTVFVVVAGVGAWLSTGPGRRRALAHSALTAALACLLAHALFAAITLAATGRLPDWNEYLAYVREFLFGDVGDLTYDVPRWSPGLAVGAGYLASAASLAELGRRRGPLLTRERPALIAIAGVTAYGISLLSYYVDRSQDHILVYVALPAVLAGTLWLALLLRSGSEVARATRRGGLAFALAVAVLVFAVAASSIGARLERSALAHAAPGGSSLKGALDRLWHPPPLAPAAPAGEAALARHLPGERRSLLMVSPDLGTEILLRAGRSDRLLLGDPWEASFAEQSELPGLRNAVDALRPGVRMLLDEPAERVLSTLRARPSLDTLADPLPTLAPLQQWALQRIDRRFTLRPVARASGGFTVVELARRG